MLIMADFHHSGAARAQYSALHCRLGHDVYFPNGSFAEWANTVSRPGDWLACLDDWKKSNGGFLDPDKPWTNSISREQFLDMDWDAVLMTRVESQIVFKELLKQHRNGAKIKRIAMTGNDGAIFEWDFVPNFMSTDYMAFIKAPADLHKIWYSQEIGAHFGAGGFRPIMDISLRSVASYVNCFPSFTNIWEWDCEFSARGGFCPHCHSEKRGIYMTATPYNIWIEAKRLLPSHKFYEYGINCMDGMVPECELPEKYYNTALTVHLKNYDGYGLSMLQSIACGRPVIVPRGFHRYRTAGKYLIDHLTCFETEWTQESVAAMIADVTSDLDKANRYARACYTASLGLFNWDLEAYRIGKFLEQLV